MYLFFYTRFLHSNGKLKITLKNVIEACLKQGVAEEKYWPFDESKIDIEPPHNIYVESCKNITGTTFEKIEISINSFKNYLLTYNIPFICFLKISKEKLIKDQRNIINGYEEVNTYHSVLVVGFDDVRQCFKFQNSYGKEWGDNGFGYFSFNYLNSIINAYSMKNSCIKSQTSKMSELILFCNYVFQCYKLDSYHEEELQYFHFE